MTAFNELKNNMELLKKYLFKMASEVECEISPEWINEKFLKENNPHVFLQLMHYIFVKFSPSNIFMRLLDQYPTIRDDPDKKFISNLMQFSRKFFQVDLKIDTEQFLSPKFLDRKVQLLSHLSKLVFQKHTHQTRANGQSRYQGHNKQQLNDLISKKKHNEPRYVDDQDFQDEEGPRNLNVAPMRTHQFANKKNTQNPQHVVKVLQESDSDEEYKELMQKKNRLKQKAKGKDKHMKNKVQAPVKSIKRPKIEEFNYGEDHMDPSISNNQFLSHLNLHEEATNYQEFANRKTVSKVDSRERPQVAKHKNIHKVVNQKLGDPRQNYQYEHANTEGPNMSQQEYVSREQFLQIVKGMNQNFSEMINKFNQFQGQVAGWVENVNAKMSMLEDSVRTIKDNL